MLPIAPSNGDLKFLFGQLEPIFSQLLCVVLEILREILQALPVLIVIRGLQLGDLVLLRLDKGNP